MMNLPAACPALGYGSYMCPSYSHTFIITDCWYCESLLPEVMRKMEELKDRQPGRFPNLRELIHPANLIYDDAYLEVFDVAVSNTIGLCPRCLARLSRVRPSSPGYR